MKNVSITKWEKLLKKDNIVEVPIDGLDDVMMTVKYSLSLHEVLQFVEDVVSSCANLETGEYTPEILDFALKAEVISMYTNFNMPSDTGKLYDLIYRTDVVRQVEQYINHDQYAEIVTAITHKLGHYAKMLQSQNALKLDMVMERINTVSEQFEAVLGGVNFTEINDMLGNINKISNLSEREIASAVLREVRSEPVVDISAASKAAEQTEDDGVMVVR